MKNGQIAQDVHTQILSPSIFYVILFARYHNYTLLIELLCELQHLEWILT